MASLLERIAHHESGRAAACITYGIKNYSHQHRQRHAALAPWRLSCASGPRAGKLSYDVLGGSGGGNFVFRIDHPRQRRRRCRISTTIPGAGVFGPLEIGVQLERMRDAARSLVHTDWGQRCIRRVAAALL